MSYQDKASPEELQYLQVFNQNLPAILAYKKAHGGDLEGAFQAVTGKPWPSDRSVKLNNGRGEITADRTVKSVLGRYVAPIGAAALTAATLGGATPLMGSIFGSELGAGEAATTLAGTGGLVPGLSTAATVAGTAAPVAGTIAKIGQAAKTGLSTYDKINGILGDTGKAIGDATTAAGNNRLEANTAAERAAHQNLTDSLALKRSDADQATLDRQALYRSTVAKNPMTSPYNTRGPQTISPEMMAGLSDMEKQALLRIGKGPTPFTPYVPKPASTLEQVGNWASPIASTLGAIGKYL